MALIRCSECGKEISDKAAGCPNCGCPMTEILAAIERERQSAIDYEIDGDTSKVKACMNCGNIHWNPNALAYQGGYCIECRAAKIYDKLKKIPFSTYEFNKRIGPVPELEHYIGFGGKLCYRSEKYSKECDYWIQSVCDLQRELFEKYVADWPTLDKNCASYKLNIETLYQNGNGEVHREIEAAAEQKAQAWAASRPLAINVPKCPTCGSTAVAKISDMKKGVSMALWGVFSNEFGKTYQCNNCGHRW